MSGGGGGAPGEQTAAAGFEDVKAKLGLAQNKSLDLEREAASLKKKVRSSANSPCQLMLKTQYATRLNLFRAQNPSTY